jgi:4-hydroxy-tetrahydrodipicolinate synthase
LPLCVYNNPGTTGFTFTDALIGEIAVVPNIAAVKMPLPAGGDFAGELARLRALAPESFTVGYSGDWGAAPSLLAGGDAFFSVAAGLLPEPMLRLVRAARSGRVDETAAIDATFAPLWELFRAYGGLRVMYAVADRLCLPVGDPPLPIQRLPAEAVAKIEAALVSIAAI